MCLFVICGEGNDLQAGVAHGAQAGWQELPEAAVSRVGPSHLLEWSGVERSETIGHIVR